MEEIIVLLKSPAFWVAALISGFLMSLVGSLLAGRVNKVFAKFNKKIAKKRETANEEILKDIDKNKNDPLAIISLKLSVLHSWIYLLYQSLLFIGGGITLAIVLPLFLHYIIVIICAVVYIIVLSITITNIGNKINHYTYVVNGLEKLKAETH